MNKDNNREEIINKVVDARLEDFAMDTTKDLMEWINYVLRNGYEGYNDMSTKAMIEELNEFGVKMMMKL